MLCLKIENLLREALLHSTLINTLQINTIRNKECTAIVLGWKTYAVFELTYLCLMKGCVMIMPPNSYFLTSDSVYLQSAHQSFFKAFVVLPVALTLMLIKLMFEQWKTINIISLKVKWTYIKLLRICLVSSLTLELAKLILEQYKAIQAHHLS